MKKQSGFTLIETLITSALVLVIMGSLYMMLIFYSEKSQTEQSRVRLQQESRFLLSMMASELKNAGSVLTLANTGGFLAKTPFFNGVYPLNNTSFPDGIIIASGDPDATTKLFGSDYDPSADGNTIVADDLTVEAGVDPWAVDDIGIIVGDEGFYVFKVQSVTGNTITKRSQSIYYSGLLSTANYTDPETDKGNNVVYPENAPVIRLTSFCIYLIWEQDDLALGRKRRDLVRVVDTLDSADVLSTSSPAEKYIIADNIWDMQLVYISYPDFPDDITTKNVYFNYNSSGTFDDLVSDIQSKTFKELELHIIALTDEYEGKGTVSHDVSNIGDHPAYTLPEGKFMYKRYKLLIEPRNYNMRF